MKSSRMKKILAVILCLTLGLSTNMMTMAESVNSPAVESVQEDPAGSGKEQTVEDAALQTTSVENTETEAVQPTEEPVPTEAPTPEATPTPTETAVPEVTAEPTEVPVEEATPVPTETPTPEVKAEPTETPTPEVTAEPTEAPVEETTPVPTEEATPEETEEPTEVPAGTEKNDVKKFETVVDGIKVTVVPESETVFPEGAELSVEKIEDVQRTDDIKDDLTEKALEKGFSLNNIVALDIKFMLNGQEVQPEGNVAVEVSNMGFDETGDLSVYHVDESRNTVEEMQSVSSLSNDDGADEVNFSTTHFSTYVIVNEGETDVQVQIQHYQQVDGKEIKLYQDDNKTVPAGEKVTDYRKAEGYVVESVYKIKGERKEEISDINNIKIAENTVLRVYYAPDSQQNTMEGDVKFWDYTIQYSTGWWSTYGINKASNFQGSDNRWITMGVADELEVTDAYGWYSARFNGLSANQYNKDQLTLGMVQGLDEDGNVIFNANQPGFFTDDNTGDYSGKDIFTEYQLKFSREGNEYVLTNVLDANGKSVAETMKEGQTASTYQGFFPLDGENVGVEVGPGSNNYNTNHNFYFGMRYDVKFSLGDYTGPLSYEFTGDDDLWVLLDGEVVLDLGGIHDALGASVDLWDELGFEQGVGATTKEEKEKEHTLTVLYMERGAGASNCQMKFILPETNFVEVSKTPKTDFTFSKCNTANEPISGAEFQLTPEDGTSGTVQNAKASEDGLVTFEDLKEGTYTLRELSVPAPYVVSSTTWKVKVVSEGEKVTAKLYDESGNEITNNTIVNYTEKEEIEKELEYDKSVTTDDEYGSSYEDRTYTLHLTANSKLESEDIPAQNASVVLILDKSTSMGSSAFRALNNAAKSFISTLADNSEQSEVAIVYFSDNVDSSGFYELSMDGCSQLNNFISRHNSPSGNTYMNKAMEKANDLLSNCQYSNKYVVFFTDGEPQGPGTGVTATQRTEDNKIANGAWTAANTIKEYGIIYTVGYGGVRNAEFWWNPGNADSQWDWSTNSNGEQQAIRKGWSEEDAEAYLQDRIASDKKYWYADTQQAIIEIFEQIAGEVGKAQAIQADKIVDIVDARFELTSEAKKTIEAKNDELKQKYDLSKDCIVVTENDDGTTTIEWTGPAALIDVKNPDGTPGWSYDIQIQAKDDFIGGNMIPTNGADSGIYLENGTTAYFPKPTVNVKLLEIEGSQKEETVFVKDKITPQDKISKLQFTIQNAELNEIPEECRLIADDMATLVNGKTVEKPYSYANTENDYVGTFTYTLTTNQSIVADHQALNKETTETYTVTLSYTPYSVDARKEKLRTGYENPVPEDQATVNPKTAEAKYKVTIVAGQLSIEKKLVSDTIRNPELEGDPVFTFEILCEYQPRGYGETTEILYRTVRIEEDKDSAVAEMIENLPRGKYTITELGTQRYTLQSVADGSGSLTGTVSEKSITFEIGCGENKENYNDLEGKSVFTNKKSGDSGKRTDTDVVINRFVRQEDNSWKVIVEKVPQNVANKEAKNSVKIEASKETAGMDSGEDQTESGDQ